MLREAPWEPGRGAGVRGGIWQGAARAVHKSRVLSWLLRGAVSWPSGSDFLKEKQSPALKAPLLGMSDHAGAKSLGPDESPPGDRGGWTVASATPGLG